MTYNINNTTEEAVFSYGGDIARKDNDRCNISIIGEDYFTSSSTPLHEGADGILYKGMDKNSEQVLAIKIVKAEVFRDSECYRRSVFREFINLKKCSHINVIKVIDIALDQKSNNLSLVTSFYPRGDLLNVLSDLRRKKIELSSELKDSIFKQVVKGVQFIHTKNVAHRDLKPENLMVDEDGKIKIGDFGCSISLDSTSNIWEEIHDNWSIILRGTDSFKAPEQFNINENIAADELKFRNFIHNFNFKSIDCWCLGILFLQIAFMQVPWSNADFHDPKNSNFRLYSENYPYSKAQITSLAKSLDDQHLVVSQNPALELFKKIHYDARALLLCVLNPDPSRRIGTKDLLSSSWLSQLYVSSDELIKLIKRS